MARATLDIADVFVFVPKMCFFYKSLTYLLTRLQFILEAKLSGNFQQITINILPLYVLTSHIMTVTVILKLHKKINSPRVSESKSILLNKIYLSSDRVGVPLAEQSLGVREVQLAVFCARDAGIQACRFYPVRTNPLGPQTGKGRVERDEFFFCVGLFQEKKYELMKTSCF